MRRVLRTATPILLLFLIGFAGASMFADVDPDPVCQGNYVQEFSHFAEIADDSGFGTEDEAASAEAAALKVDDSDHTMQKVDSVSNPDAGQWMVTKDGKDVAGFSVQRTESGRFIVDSRLACVLDDGITPVDASLDLSRMTDYQDFSTHLTEEEWQAKQETKQP